MCTAFLDSLNGNARHITQRVNLAIVAKGPIDMVQAFADERGWTNLRMLSSATSSYNADYFTEEPDDEQEPALHTFVRREGKIHHYYASELFSSRSRRVILDTWIWRGLSGRCSMRRPMDVAKTGSP